MTLNASGPLSMGGSTAGQSINLELGVSATALASINSASFRTLAGVASGQISISNFYGKSNALPIAFNTAKMASSGSQDYFYNSQFSTCVPYGGSIVFAGGAGGSNMYMSKFNGTTGAMTWAKYCPAGFGINTPCSTTDSAGDSYYCSTMQSGTGHYITKMDTNGTVLYSKLFSPSGAGGSWYIKKAFCDSSNNLYLQSYQYNYPNSTGYLFKFDSSFTFLWGVRIGNDAYFGGAIHPSTGDIWVASGYGAYITRITSNGATMQSFQLPYAGQINTEDIAIDSSGNIYTTGSGYVVKMDSAFSSVQWIRQVSTGQSYGKIIVTSNGIIVSTSNALNSGNFTYLYGISSSGSLQFSNMMAPQNPSYPGALPARWGTDGSSLFFTGMVALPAVSSADGAAYQVNYGGIAGNIPVDGTGRGVYTLCSTRGLLYYSSAGGSLSTPSTPPVYPYTAGATASQTGSVSNSGLTSWVNNTNTTFPVNGGSVSATTGSDSYIIPGTYSWVCPTGVSSVSVVAVGGGGGGQGGNYFGVNVAAGGGGGLGYRNAISVTAGSSYTVVVGSGGAGGPGNNSTSSSGTTGGTSSFTAGFGTLYAYGGAGGSAGNGGGPGGGYGNASGGGSGGTGGGGAQVGGGGGAGGYSGNGGNGGSSGSGSNGAGGGGGGAGSGNSYAGGYDAGGAVGGGVGLGGLGANGVGGAPTNYGGYPGSNGSYTGRYGGGGNGGSYYLAPTGCPCDPYYWVFGAGGYGAAGAVRIVYPGTRNFPSAAGSP